MAVFDGVCYSLSPSLSPTRRNELAAVLDLNGAAPHPPYTHLIAPAASNAHNNATSDPAIKLVTDHWVDRSVVMGKRQPEQYYSPDPAMIFSGVVACATDLSAADLEVLSAGITALGGQWRVGLTRDVTHLFALRTGSDKYNTALHFAPQTHMCVLTPHWFDDAVRLGRRIPETPYTWPDPLVLRPGTILDLDGPLTVDGRRRRKPTAGTDAETGDGTNVLSQGEPVRVWADRRILLSASLELAEGSRRAIEVRIQRAGGVVVPVSDDADEDAEEKAVDESDVLVTRWRSGKSYFKAARASLLIGTLSWLFSVESSGTLHSPLDSLLWYPTPKGGIHDLIDCEISITNYTGAARDYLKRLITLVGAKFTPSMSQSNKVLIAGFQPSPKTTRALSWSIPVVNHTWLEDCFVEWRSLTVGLERYIVYSPGVDFGRILMTRQDGPLSQSVPAMRLSGGAVPGGRGISAIDLEQEEMRDAEYRARARRDILVQLTSHAALPNPTATDEVSMALSDVEALADAQVRPRLRATSVKKTPSSVRIRRGSMSTPMTVSATGAFVDHVIELPADGDVDVDGKRHSPKNGKQRARTTSVSSRATPQSVPRSSKDVYGEKENGKQKISLERKVMRSAKGTEEQARVGTSKLHSGTGEGEGEGSEMSVPPRSARGAGSRTPIKSGMKPRPRSQSRPRSGLDEDSEEEVRVAGAQSGTSKRREVVAKTPPNGAVVTKKASRKREKIALRSRSPAHSSSSTSPNTKSLRTPKRRLSVVVPPVPKEYFSSQGAPETESEGDGPKIRKTGVVARGARKQLTPVASIRAVAAEASSSTNKRIKPSPAKVVVSIPISGKSKLQPQPQIKLQHKSRTSKEGAKSRTDESVGTCEEEEDNDTSMIVDGAMTSTSRGGSRRNAANKATTRLREEIMPDVVSFEKEQKQAKRRRSAGGESVMSAREVVKEERGGKRRKVATEVEEEEEEAEVEDVVLVPTVNAKPTLNKGKGKVKRTAVVGSDEDTDPPTKNRPNRSQETKGVHGRGKELAAVRLITTGVTLLDDVVKRLTKLGVQMTTKPIDCTHLIAKGIVRTEKFLCAMSVSPYVLTEEWANASAKSGKLLPENGYLLSDIVAEQKWAFKLADAMTRAKGPEGGPNLFKQMTFYVTPKVAVDAKLLKNVISAGGGQVQTSTTPTVRILKGKANRYVISCQEDKGIWRPLAQEGLKVYSSELVLRGALRQEIEWEKRECLVAG